jgi:hypothetical protein
MKKLLFTISISLLALATFAQSEKYTSAMKEKIAALDTTQNPVALRELGNGFERIAQAEKNQWLPYYYAALAHVNAGYSMTGGQMGGMADKIDPLADKADELISKAEELSRDNSEIYVVKKMVASLRLMADPMSRYMKYGPVAQEALESAKRLNAANPRIYILEAQDKYFTPEQYGGSKDEAKKLFSQALEKFNTFRPETSLHPHWGKAMAEYFLSQYK